MMRYLQKLGKALFLPVAILPICGILMGLGYAIAPGVMGVPDDHHPAVRRRCQRHCSQHDRQQDQ